MYCVTSARVIMTPLSGPGRTEAWKQTAAHVKGASCPGGASALLNVVVVLRQGLLSEKVRNTGEKLMQSVGQQRAVLDRQGRRPASVDSQSLDRHMIANAAFHHESSVHSVARTHMVSLCCFSIPMPSQRLVRGS